MLLQACASNPALPMAVFRAPDAFSSEGCTGVFQHRRTGAQALHVSCSKAVGGKRLLYDEELLVLFGPDDF
ncbi:MAG: hypothetical protein IPM93_24525 [Candidatus Obscuribacter sp.]|nr:hypothetical protein [Candidatus Obscuribacter sp.]